MDVQRINMQEYVICMCMNVYECVCICMCVYAYVCARICQCTDISKCLCMWLYHRVVCIDVDVPNEKKEQDYHPDPQLQLPEGKLLKSAAPLKVLNLLVAKGTALVMLSRQQPMHNLGKSDHWIRYDMEISKNSELGISIMKFKDFHYMISGITA